MVPFWVPGQHRRGHHPGIFVPPSLHPAQEMLFAETWRSLFSSPSVRPFLITLLRSAVHTYTRSDVMAAKREQTICAVATCSRGREATSEKRRERRPWRAEIVIDEHMLLYLLGRSCDQAGSAVCEEDGRRHCFLHCAPIFSSLHFPYGLLVSLCKNYIHGL